MERFSMDAPVDPVSDLGIHPMLAHNGALAPVRMTGAVIGPHFCIDIGDTCGLQSLWRASAFYDL